MIRRLLVFALASVAAAVCAPAGAANHVVTVIDSAFNQAEITIQVGDTVTFQKSGGTLPHNVVADGFNGSCSFGPNCFRCGSGNGCAGQGASGLATSAGFSFTLDFFDQSGTFRYYCEVHGSPNGFGMAGRIIVQGAAPTPTPSPTPPSDDPGTIRFTAANYNRSESIGTASIQVERTSGDDGAVGVSFASTGGGTATAGADFTAVAGTLDWADGEDGVKVISMTIANDDDDEANETVNLVLQSPSGGAALGSPSSATVTIVDNDGAATAGEVGFTSAAVSVGETVPLATVSVSRTGGSQGAVAVEYDTSDGSAEAGQDYTAVGGSLNWGSGDAADKSFQIPILDDIDFEGDESLSVSLSQPSGGVAVGQPAAAVVTINDNETVPACEDGDTQVCLLDRFLVLIHWMRPNLQSGEGRATKLTDSSASFEFFEVGNVEMVVKMRGDPCLLPPGNPLRNFWVFVAGLTNVRVEMTIVDTKTGTTRRFFNALNSPFFTPAADSPDGKQNPPGAIQATTAGLGAFPTCDD